MISKNSRLFLQSLKEEGIEEIYLPSTALIITEPTICILSKASSPPEIQPSSPISSSAANSLRDQMIDLRSQAFGCTRCGELAATRKSVVFGAGNLEAEVVFVGEAPGKDEDEQGLPFVGAAGQLLTKIIEAIGYTRKQVFICNVLKCRPPGNRTPHPDEIINCQPYLKSQLALIKPKMICALGNHAAHTLLGMEKPMSQLRGYFYDYEGIRLTCTYHPAYLLRNPEDKKKVWEDMKRMRREIDLLMARDPMF